MDNDDMILLFLMFDCVNCVVFCCVSFVLDKGLMFVIDKDVGMFCLNLNGYKCGIYFDLKDCGFKGCILYECVGVG